MKDGLACLDNLGILATMDYWDFLGLTVSLVRQAPWVRLDLPVLPDQQDSLDLPVLPVRLDLPVLPDHRDP